MNVDLQALLKELSIKVIEHAYALPHKAELINASFCFIFCFRARLVQDVEQKAITPLMHVAVFEGLLWSMTNGIEKLATNIVRDSMHQYNLQVLLPCIALCGVNECVVRMCDRITTVMSTVVAEVRDACNHICGTKKQ